MKTFTTSLCVRCGHGLGFWYILAIEMALPPSGQVTSLRCIKWRFLEGHCPDIRKKAPHIHHGPLCALWLRFVGCGFCRRSDSLRVSVIAINLVVSSVREVGQVLSVCRWSFVGLVVVFCWLCFALMLPMFCPCFALVIYWPIFAHILPLYQL